MQVPGDAFAYNSHASPWSKTSPSIPVAFDTERSRWLELAVDSVVKTAGVCNTLVPLSKAPDALPGGVVDKGAFFALIRKSGVVDQSTEKPEITVVQFRVTIGTADGVIRRKARPIYVSKYVQTKYDAFHFGTTHVISGETMVNVYWDVLRSNAFAPFLTPEFRNFEHNQSTFGFIHPDTSVTQFNADVNKQIEFILREVCAGNRSSVLVPMEANAEAFVALVRNGQVVKASSIMISQGRNFYNEKSLVYPDGINAMIPGFQFTTGQLTDAERNTLIQEPILEHYLQETKQRLDECYHSHRLSALAMGLHPRLGEKSLFRTMQRDAMVLVIAELVKDLTF